jgi:hypothetical protein
MEPALLESQSRQRREALARANLVRLARAQLKRRIAQGEVTAAQVILVSRWEMESMPIAEVLTSQPQWGKTRCRRALMTLRMHEHKTIGSMTQRQRLALAALLTGNPGSDRWRGSDVAANGDER